MSSSTHTSSRFPIPNWASLLFSSFPLILYPQPQIFSPEPTLATLPTLYISPPHPSPSSASSPSWPSRDPISLHYQLELTLRGIEFNCKYLDQQDSFAGNLPFLLLPNPPGITRPNLIKRKDLDRYLENYVPFDYQREELREENVEKENRRKNPYRDEKLGLEALSWRYSFEREGLAGVLLATLLLTPQPLPSPHSGFLSKSIQSHLQSSSFISSLSSIAHLSGLASIQSSEKSVTGYGWFSNVSWGGPAVITNGVTTLSTSTEEEEEEIDEVEVNLEMREEIVQKCEKLIEGIGRRIEQLEDGDGEDDWVLGARSPTSLDALLFSILHTILSLPLPSAQSKPLSSIQEEGLKISSRLRKAVENHPTLLKFTRRVWETKVRDKKVGKDDFVY